ncbi:DgyrCDS11011 [Dimorphilus gyrociliatus]|uniref:DgyrCDS11011 n=1 Tax=Dimorphilus gyrociliatus TaxID=2664684 RepID=A0A7I8W4J9_9ANNE|nr:DgyrCDS11011 [Dimorphilus gyrociliatus]
MENFSDREFQLFLLKIQNLLKKQSTEILAEFKEHVASITEEDTDNLDPRQLIKLLKDTQLILKTNVEILREIFIGINLEHLYKNVIAQVKSPSTEEPPPLKTFRNAAKEILWDYVESDPQQIRHETIKKDHDVPSERTHFTEEESSEHESTESTSHSNDIVLRNYQLELAEEGLSGENTIICAPTGSGKTYTAAHICSERSRKITSTKHNGVRIVFVVPLKALKDQQRKAFRAYFENVHSVGPDNTLRELLKSPNKAAVVVMLTAQNLVNAIEEPSSSNRKVALEEIDILVMDECHHTKKNHPYAKIMHHCMQNTVANKQIPQLIGLSASLGAGSKGEEFVTSEESITFNHYVNLCAFYHAHKISYVVNYRQEIEQLINKSEELIKPVPARKQGDYISVLREISERIMKDEDAHFAEIGFDITSSQFENWIVDQKNKAISNGEAVTKDACFYLQHLRKAVMFYEDFQIEDSYLYLNEIFSNCHDVTSPNRTKWIRVFHEYIDRIDIARHQDLLENNQLVEILIKEIKEIYNKNPKSQGLILCRTVYGTRALHRIITEQMPNYKVSQIFGTNQCDGKIQMTEKSQQRILNCFRDGKLQILVGTDILQEAHDLPACNFVIRYNFVSNEIGSVQVAQGRARAKDSQCVLIVREDSNELMREQRNRIREIKMIETLDEINSDPSRIRMLVDKAINENIEEEIRRSRVTREDSEVDLSTFVFCCGSCARELFTADQLRKNGQQYICIDPEFPSKIDITNYSTPMPFSRDDHEGKFFCKAAECSDRKEKRDSLGTLIRYKCPYPREIGYVMSIRALSMRKVDTARPSPLKKWTKLLFPENCIIRDE